MIIYFNPLCSGPQVVSQFLYPRVCYLLLLRHGTQAIYLKRQGCIMEHERLVGLFKPSCFIIHPQIFKKNANHLPKVAPIFTKYFLQIQKNIHDYKNLNSSEEIVRPHLNSRCSGFINEICLQMFKFTCAICKYVSYMFYFCNYSLPSNMDGIFCILCNL